MWKRRYTDSCYFEGDADLQFTSGLSQDERKILVVFERELVITDILTDR